MEHLRPNDSRLGTEGLRLNDPAAGEALATVADPKALATVLGSSDLRLPNCDFHGWDLSGANLSYAYLRKANLSGCDLSNADLSYANLQGADLTNANLTGANLIKAKMNGTKLFGAILPTESHLARPVPHDKPQEAITKTPKAEGGVRMERIDAEALLRLAGVEKFKADGTVRRKYSEKLDQIIEFRFTQAELVELATLPFEILSFLFDGTLTQSNRKALFEGMRGDWQRACEALIHLDGEELMTELSRLCGYQVVKTTAGESKMWNSIGLSLAAGTDENPLEFFGGYGRSDSGK